jgi:RHS repeat-associated protein
MGATLPFGYTGEQEDAESGLVYLRARYMDPGTGRFLTTDPVPGFQLSPATQHAYGYVRNQPTMLRDPRGLCGDPTTTTLSTGNDCGGGDISAAEAAVEYGQQLAAAAAPLPGAGGPGGRPPAMPGWRRPPVKNTDWDHTLDNHAPWGSRANLPGKTVFSNCTEAETRARVESAWRRATKAGSPKMGPGGEVRQRYRGTDPVSGQTIETAYPVFGGLR